MSKTIRLDKYLSDMTSETRSKVKEYIRKGRVTANGVVIKSPETKVDTDNDEICIEELNKNEVLLDSMLFRMIQLSENARKLSDTYKDNNRNIPWNAIYGLRNRIVHDYGNVDLNVVFETLKNDIPELLAMISKS